MLNPKEALPERRQKARQSSKRAENRDLWPKVCVLQGTTISETAVAQM